MQVVIVGAGIAGASVAYHLAKSGYRDVSLIDQGVLAGGTTWHAAGMVTRWRVSGAMARVNQASARLYAEFSHGDGRGAGWRQVGSLALARRPERMQQYGRTAAMAGRLGIESHRLTPEECAARFPGIRTNDLQGGYWIPGDGRCHPENATKALVEAARGLGVSILERTHVERIERRGGRAAGVWTSQGLLSAEAVVLCSGMWTRSLAATVGLAAPLHPVEHLYAVTRTHAGWNGGLPCTRDMDGAIYFRGEDGPDGGQLIVGAFPEMSRVWDVEAPPRDFIRGLLPPDWDRFEAASREARWRVPHLAEAGWERMVNGPESFTPDNHWLMGEASGVPGLWILAGFNSAGIASAGGAGEALAQWMMAGEMPYDLTAFDLGRFGPWANNSAFLRERVVESVGLHYQMAWPNRQLASGRGRRVSPLHGRLAAAGACFGVCAGWERPLWFAADEAGCARLPEIQYGFGRQNWFGNLRRELAFLNQSVGLVDFSWLGMLRLKGTSVAFALSRAANRFELPVGGLAQMVGLNRRGGVACAPILWRADPDNCWLWSNPERLFLDRRWFQQASGPSNPMEVEEVDGVAVCVGLVGPLAAEALKTLGREGLLNDGGVATAVPLPWSDAAWMLVSSPAGAGRVVDSAFVAAAGLDGGWVGFSAFESWRLARGLPRLGADAGIETTPYELGWADRLDWGRDFLGRPALEAMRREPVTRRIALLALADADSTVWGGEPIRARHGAAGVTTSAGWSEAAGRTLALAAIDLPNPIPRVSFEEWALTANFEIDAPGGWLPARLAAVPAREGRGGLATF